MRGAGIEPIFLRVAPADIAFVKFLFESYEGVGIVRTLDRKRAVIVALIVPDHMETARQIVRALQEQIQCEVVPPPADFAGDWLLGALQNDSGDDAS